MTTAGHATYDHEADAFYLYLVDNGRFDHMADLDGQRIVDYDAEGRAIGVEVLFASHGTDLEGLPQPGQIREALERFGLPVKTPA